MQLVAYGAQDIYLTGNPQITFFKVVYRRHTNFSMESIKQTFNGTAGFGSEVSATISRNGDLVYRMYLEHSVTFQSGAQNNYLNICPNYGSNLIKECELEIGGQKIDKHYSHWHSVYSQLTELNPSGAFENWTAANEDVKSTLFNTMSGNGGVVSTSGATTYTNENGSWTCLKEHDADVDTATGLIFIPLYFWFCRNPGLALPLIALQYHEVKVKMTFDDKINLAHNIVDGGDDVLSNANNKEVQAVTASVGPTFDLWRDYIYLDTDERRRFAQVSHEYLIEQLQFQSFNSATMDLNFNHPVKELIWTDSTWEGLNGANDTNADVSISKWLDVAGAANFAGRDATAITSGRVPQALTGNYKLKLNGHDRFKERDFKYFTRTQVWEHHTGYGSTILKDGIAVYSFALKPEEHQPSGTCNFSRIDNAQLVGTSSGATFNVYAVNYNVLRIMSGMGGLAYSN